MDVVVAAVPSAAWIAATLAIFFACRALYLRLRVSWLSPVLWSTIIVALLVVLTGQARDAFKAETYPLVWLLVVRI